MASRKTPLSLWTTFSITAVLLMPIGAKAQASHDLPSNLCYSGCGPRMEQIVRGFENAGALAPSSTPRLYSGVCMHQVRELGPEDEHHGVIVLENRQGSDYFNGEFSFYAKENPYKDWTRDEAARRLNLKYTDQNKINHERDYAWLDYNPETTSIWQYYLRRSGSTVYLVGFWGIKHTVFCELKENMRN